MPINNKIRALLAISATLFLITLLCALAPVMHKGHYIEIFLNNKGQSLWDKSEAYIVSCCSGRDQAISLLEANGFRIFLKTYSPDELYPSEKKHYQEILYGKRKAPWFRFWDIFATYEVTVYINNQKVEKVSTRVTRTLP